MPSIHYGIPQLKVTDLSISVSELVARYFHGISLTDQNGNTISDEAIASNIRYAQEQIEGYLNVKSKRAIISESLSYHLTDFREWGFIPTTYPVEVPLALSGELGNTLQVEYPVDWSVVKETNAGIQDLQRQMHIVPIADSTSFTTQHFIGKFPQIGFYGSNHIPQYWRVTYCTPGYGSQSDILMAIGKLATLNIFHQLGDIILGAGIANQSISIDGLSQSIGTTSSATNAGYGARVSGYIADLKREMPLLHRKYGALNLGVL